MRERKIDGERERRVRKKERERESALHYLERRQLWPACVRQTERERESRKRLSAACERRLDASLADVRKNIFRREAESDLRGSARGFGGDRRGENRRNKRRGSCFPPSILGEA